jgi:hypothetical protein
VSYIVAIETGAIELVAIDLAAPNVESALPMIPAGVRTARVTALPFKRTLSELELEPGPIATVEPEARSARPIPFEALGFEADVADGKSDGWSPPMNALPDALAALRIGAGECAPAQTLKLVPIANHIVVGQCVDPRRPVCWQRAQQIELSANPSPNRSIWGGFLAAEGDALWFYFSTNVLTTESWTQLLRERFSDPISPEAQTIEPLAASDIGGPMAIGWNYRPLLRPDLLEMFFASSRPDADWRNPRLYLLARPRVGAWALDALPLDNLNAGVSTGLSEPALLRDNRTLLYVEGLGEIRYAVRNSTLAGDSSFVPQGVAPFDQRLVTTSSITLVAVATSCDGWHLIYVLRYSTSPTAWIAEIETLDPLTFGPPEPYPLPLGPSGPLNVSDGNLPNGVENIVESADCSTLYVSLHDAMLAAKRCP